MRYCLPYLRAQIDVVNPDCWSRLASTAAQGLLGFGTFKALGDIRGKWHEFAGKPLMVTYHPSYILRNQSNRSKRMIWDDLLKVMERAGLPVSEKQRGFFLWTNETRLFSSRPGGSAGAGFATASVGGTRRSISTCCARAPKRVAAKPYAPPQGEVPEWLRKLTYDELRLIEFDGEQSLWFREKLPFQAQFLHPGFLFDKTVQLSEVRGKQA